MFLYFFNIYYFFIGSICQNLISICIFSGRLEYINGNISILNIQIITVDKNLRVSVVQFILNEFKM